MPQYKLVSTVNQSLIWDQQAIAIVDSGVPYTNLQITAPSQIFVKNPNATGTQISPNSIKLTATLYGELKEKENEIVWTVGNTTVATGAFYTINSGDFTSGNTAITAKASIKNGVEDIYDDEFTVRLLTEGEDSVSVFLSDGSFSFAADSDGNVAADVKKETRVQVFHGASQIASDKIEIKTIENCPTGLNYKISNNVITFSTSAKTNLGEITSCSGQIKISGTVKINDTDNNFVVGLAWDKVNSGRDSYALALDNDFDVAVKLSSGDYLVDSSNKITVTATRYRGEDLCNIGSVRCLAPSGDAIDSTDSNPYYFSGSTLTIQSIPANMSFPAYFTFEWLDAKGDKITSKKFTLNTVTSLVDYDLIIPQTVFNNTNTSDNPMISVSILAKTKDGTSIISNAADAATAGVGIYYSTNLTSRITDWSQITYNSSSTSIELVLKSIDGTLVWDRETIEFVKDGAPSTVAGPGAITLDLTNDNASITTPPDGTIGTDDSSKALLKNALLQNLTI